MGQSQPKYVGENIIQNILPESVFCWKVIHAEYFKLAVGGRGSN
jgi:hypothetical protein